MKIYNKVVMNMNTWETIEEDFFEYRGEIARCGPIAPVLPYLPYIIPALIGTAGSMYTQSRAEKQSSSAQEDAFTYAEQARAYAEKNRIANEKAWKENAFPSASEIQAKRESGLSTLGAERTKRLDLLSRSAAERGWGAGSGLLTGAASNIEGGYLSGLSNLENNLTNLQYTPRFNYPFGSGAVQYPPNYTSGSYNSNAYGNTNPLGMAIGGLLYKGTKGNKGTPYENLIPNFDYENTYYNQ